MKVHPVDPSNLELLHVVKAECQICYLVEYVESTDISEGCDMLHEDGWRTVEIDGTINDPVCPTCQQKIKDENSS